MTPSTVPPVPLPSTGRPPNPNSNRTMAPWPACSPARACSDARGSVEFAGPRGAHGLGLLGEFFHAGDILGFWPYPPSALAASTRPTAASTPARSGWVRGAVRQCSSTFFSSITVIGHQGRIPVRFHLVWTPRF